MVRLSKIYRILISSLLAFLGFSCGNGGGGNDGNNEWGSPAEYGMPSATYKAKGIVVSEADNKPIKGINIVLKGYYNIVDIAYTDEEGSFSLRGDDFPYQELSVKLTDEDGEENGGLFSEMEIEADYTDKTFTGGSGAWYKGEAELDLGTIKMKPETKDEI